MSYNYLAIDLGATSGRSILATIVDGQLNQQELTRFPNTIFTIHGKCYWNIYSLYGEILHALCVATSKGVMVASVGIDTWGVDFVYVGDDGAFLELPRAYRDSYTRGVPEEFFKSMPAEELYDRTGIQVMNFNSLFQLFAARREGNVAYGSASKLLFIPDALSYLLTGEMVCEYSIASTSQMLDPRTKQFDKQLLAAVGVDEHYMPPVVMPGTRVGMLLSEIAKELGVNPMPIIAVAGHDTASAIAAIPTIDENFAYMSSGTWSLMGIEVKDAIINSESCLYNFTNEGGVEGTTRFLKNITGMWLLEQCRKEWAREGVEYSYSQIIDLCAEAEPFLSLVDPDDYRFTNPDSMTTAIRDYCCERQWIVPQSHAQIIRCIFESLAMKYRTIIEILKHFSPHPIERLHIIGGGSQNMLLNQMSADSTGLTVIAGPCEATSIGNIMVQAKAIGLVDSLSQMRRIVADSVTLVSFEPQNREAWSVAYEQFRDKCLIKEKRDEKRVD